MILMQRQTFTEMLVISGSAASKTLCNPSPCRTSEDEADVVGTGEGKRHEGTKQTHAVIQLSLLS